MGDKLRTILMTGALALLCSGCADTRTEETTEKPRIIPDQEEETKFDLPAHHFIFRGMDTDRLTSLVGAPKRKEDEGKRQEWYYDWGMVLLRQGEVVYKHPPSKGVDQQDPGDGKQKGMNQRPSQ